MPSKVKYRKQQRGRMKGKATRGSTLAFGDTGLQILEPGWITNRQIEAARIAMTRKMKRGGKVWINIFPDKPYTKKPAETRMGSGKGAPEGWVAVVKPGRVLFEMSGVTEELAREAMRLASHKLPIDVKFVVREKQEVESEEEPPAARASATHAKSSPVIEAKSANSVEETTETTPGEASEEPAELEE